MGYQWPNSANAAKDWLVRAQRRGHLEAGANLVQIYTGLIDRGPALVREVALALKARSAS